MNQQPEVLKKKEQRKKRSRIWGICGQISSLTDIFSKRKLVPDVLQKSAMTFCKQDASLDENLVQLTKWCPSYIEFILLLVYSLLFFLIWLYSKLFPEVTSLHLKCNLREFSRVISGFLIARLWLAYNVVRRRNRFALRARVGRSDHRNMSALEG